ncbi:ATP-dependent RNA helicase DDX42 [Phlebotomus argentipes]|uniref:ATP-dependent RNA helicase DDX42 n=1 Tax=Phlebotomus argentipes TaxID=94469 RepID=UPI002892FFAA|nr:ATP-dependent RNA helicase DDX42 [Phlebotomus argentipes]
MSSNRGNSGSFNFGGFQMKKPPARSTQSKQFSLNAVPPPSSLNHSVRSSTSGASGFGAAARGAPVSKHGYSTMDAISQFANTSQYAVGKKRAKTEDEYFDDDDEPPLAYIPAPNSPTQAGAGAQAEEDEDDDPLDAFMAGIEQQVERESRKVATNEEVQSKKGIRGDIDDEDDEESYYRYMEENPMAGVLDDGSDAEMEYDEDGNPIPPPRKRDIDPLPFIDHSEIDYAPFEKNFYDAHEEITALSVAQVENLRKALGIRVTGLVPPHPVASFAHFNFDENLMKAIRKADYTQPTPIQAQAIPAALGGRDLIGIAKTGSGKTAAFIWPMLVHIMDQKELQPGDGPIGLILAPTRELSLQIYNEAKRFGKVYNIFVVCCYGGGSKWEQSKALEKGAEIVVATPGRMIDMVKIKATNLRRVSFLVLDEADKMFNMGFEPQVRSICNHVRPDRQTLLFSATFKKRIEKLARDVLTDPVRIVQGDLGEANEDITQHMLVFSNPQHKWNWLLAKLVQFLSEGSVLIFVTKKADAEQVANNLQLKEYDPVLLHGDMDQADRNRVIMQFKKREVDIMVATDVAARGLDIPHIKTVVNYDIARDIDTHTHRIGRTGRAGEKGTAYTLVTDKDKEFAGHLVRNLEGANQEVPKDLLNLAMQSSWFRKSRFKSGKAKAVNVGGAGLGYRERPSSSGDSSAAPANNHGAMKASKGPATDRLTAMRETFRNQYNSQFKASSDRTWEKTLPPQGVFVAPGGGPASSPAEPAAPKKAKKSRWN